MGRRTILTPELQKNLCDRVEHLAATIREASADLGISEQAVYQWVRKGEEAEKRGGRLTKTERRYVAFVKAITAARARRSMVLKGKISKAGEKDWKAYDRIGQLTDPAQFLPQVRVHVTHELTGAIERLKATFAGDPDALRRALSALAGESGEGGTPRDADGDGGADTDGGEAVRAPPAEPSAE